MFEIWVGIHLYWVGRARDLTVKIIKRKVEWESGTSLVRTFIVKNYFCSLYGIFW